MIGNALFAIVIAGAVLIASAVVYLEVREQGYCIGENLCTAKAWARKEPR